MKRELAISTLAVVAAGFLAVGYYSGQQSGAVAPGASAVSSVAVSSPQVAQPSSPAAPPPTAAPAYPSPAASATPAPAAAPAPTPPATQAAVQPPTPPSPPPPVPSSPAAAPASGEEQIWRVLIHQDDARIGPDTAPATVAMFCAFGAPECGPTADWGNRLREKYGDKVRYVFKHKLFPDTAYGMEASVAAIAAQAQGKFWEYHDKLYANASAFDAGSLERYATEVGLDAAKFKAAVEKQVGRGQALRDSLVANEIGAHSFPNILVNGVRLKEKTFEGLVELVDAQIAVGEAKIKAGSKADAVYEELVKGGKVFPQLEGPKITVNTARSVAIGPEAGKAVVEVVLFEDFECPFCAQVGPPFKEFQKRFPDKVRVVFKHMPLESIHPKAQLASEASMAAHAQGKFWEYHDILFANQKQLDRPDLERYAEMVGLDMARFRSELDQGTHRAAVQADFQEGARVGVGGTPSVYLNGQKYAGPRGFPPEGIEAVSRVYLGLTD